MEKPSNDQAAVANGPKILQGAVVLIIGIFVAAAILTAIGAGSTTSQPPQDSPRSTLEAKAHQEQLAAQAAALKQSTIDRLGPQYCANHKKIRMQKVDWLVSKGLPVFDGDGSFTAEQCRVIIDKLYDIDSNVPDLESVAKGKIGIGMRVELVVYSWGAPNDANSTNTAFGNSSQWVYGDPLYGASYVYLNNGVVTATQN